MMPKQFLTGSAAGQTVTLPDSTALVGRKYVLFLTFCVRTYRKVVEPKQTK